MALCLSLQCLSFFVSVLLCQSLPQSLWFNLLFKKKIKNLTLLVIPSSDSDCLSRAVCVSAFLGLSLNDSGCHFLMLFQCQLSEHLQLFLFLVFDKPSTTTKEEEENRLW